MYVMTLRRRVLYDQYNTRSLRGAAGLSPGITPKSVEISTLFDYTPNAVVELLPCRNI